MGGPSGGVPPGDSFVVRVERRRVRRDIAISAVSAGFVVLLTLKDWSEDDRWGTRVVVAIVAGMLLALPWQIRSWRRLLAADALVEIGPAGMRVATADGPVDLPWEAIGVVRRDLWDQLVIKPAAGASLPGGRWPRGLTAWLPWRSRYLVPMRSVAWDVTQVLAAVRHYRGGRL